MSQTRPAPEAPDESSYDDELIAGHEYDGIQEYDNPIPDWLSLLFIGTVVWSVLYVAGIGLGYIDDYGTSLEESREELAYQRAAAATEGPDAEKLQKAADNPDRVAAGEQVFADNCVSCHGEQGGGTVGPNLADTYWVHGGTLPDIYEVVRDGVSDAGMPAWGPQLSDEELIDVVAYVRSLQGTDPPDAKPPEGDEYTPDG